MSPKALNRGLPLPVPTISEWNYGTLYLYVPLYWHICKSLKITTVLVFVHVLNTQETDECKIKGTWSNVWQEWMNKQTWMSDSAKQGVWHVMPNFYTLGQLIDSANLLLLLPHPSAEPRTGARGVRWYCLCPEWERGPWWLKPVLTWHVGWHRTQAPSEKNEGGNKGQKSPLIATGHIDSIVALMAQEDHSLLLFTYVGHHRAALDLVSTGIVCYVNPDPGSLPHSPKTLFIRGLWSRSSKYIP